MPLPDTQRQLLAGLPPAVRAALEDQDVQAFDLTLRAMPIDQAADLLRQLVAAGLVAARTQAELDWEQRLAYTPPDDRKAV